MVEPGQALLPLPKGRNLDPSVNPFSSISSNLSGMNLSAQTVENVFALSFLVKDGRVAVVLDDNGSHLVSIRNAPYRSTIVSEEVKFHQFIFRLDFSDWKRMIDYVPEGEELMPPRGINPKTCKDNVKPESDFNSKTFKVEENLESVYPRRCFVDPRYGWGSRSMRSPAVKKAKLNGYF